MTTVPTRWRTAILDQLTNAAQRVESAMKHLDAGDGSRALQEAYPAVVAAATIRAWKSVPPWRQPLSTEAMHRRVQEQFPSLFAALVELDLQQVLTSPWRSTDARAYVFEARDFVAETQQQVQAWLGQT